jgi:hypothetical protein
VKKLYKRIAALTMLSLMAGWAIASGGCSKKEGPSTDRILSDPPLTNAPPPPAKNPLPELGSGNVKPESAKPRTITLSPDQRDDYGEPYHAFATSEGAKIYKEDSRDSDLVAEAKWMTPYVVIAHNTKAGMTRVGEYVSRTKAKPVGWMRFADLSLRDKAIKSEGIYVKALPVTRFDDENDKVEGTKLRNAPGEEGDVIGQEMTQFGIYFVYAEYDDTKSGNRYYLMGNKPEIFDKKKPGETIMGWARAHKMHRWETRLAAEYDKSTLAERGPVKIYATEADVRAALAGDKNVQPLFIENAQKTYMQYTDMRYPIIGPEREVNGSKYWNVAVTSEITATKGISHPRIRSGYMFNRLPPSLDILFVIDGSGAMKAHKQSVVTAVKAIQSAVISYWKEEHHKGEQKHKLRFSLTLYKDYTEKDYYRRTPLEERNAGEIAAILNACNFQSGHSAPAVFHGLSTTIKDISGELNDESFRAVFLIGGMGNLGKSREPDKNGHSTESIIRLLKTNAYDFHAIQVGTEYLKLDIPEDARYALTKFQEQAEKIKNDLPEGYSSYTPLENDPLKATVQIKEKVTGILDQRFRVLADPPAPWWPPRLINTLIQKRAIDLMKQNGIDPREFAQKRIFPFFEGWVAPVDPVTGKRRMKEVILMDRREVEFLLGILGRLTVVKPQIIKSGWIKVLSEVAGDDIKVGVNDSPAELFRIWTGLPIKSGILNKSFDALYNLPVAEKAEAIKGFEQKLFLLRGVVGEKEIEITEDPKTGRTSYKVKGDKQYWFGHRGSFHAWLDPEVYIP